MTDTTTPTADKTPPTTTAAAPANALETAPCFCCAATQGVPTGGWWLLPLLSHHVRCVDCGRTYNAQTGDSNAPVFFMYFAFGVMGALLGVLAFFFAQGL